MSYLILLTIILLLVLPYSSMKLKSRMKKNIIIPFLIAICLIIFAGMRSSYNDTYAYIANYLYMSHERLEILLEQDFAISNVIGFNYLTYISRLVFGENYHLYFALCSSIIVIPSIRIIDRYSENFTLSIFLFLTTGIYLFSLAGLKQALAMGILMIAIPYLCKKLWLQYYALCLLAISFHTYAIVFLPLPLLGQDLWNRRTVITFIAIVVMGICISYVTPIITFLTSLLGKDTSEETLSSGSVNIMRLMVYLVPIVLAILGRKEIKAKCSSQQQLIIKIGLLSSITMFLAAFGNPILFGRIPQYFLIGIVITLPLLIRVFFSATNKILINFCAYGGYFAFCLYGLHVDRAFTEDIFNLEWIF